MAVTCLDAVAAIMISGAWIVEHVATSMANI